MGVDGLIGVTVSESESWACPWQVFAGACLRVRAARDVGAPTGACFAFCAVRRACLIGNRASRRVWRLELHAATSWATLNPPQGSRGVTRRVPDLPTDLTEGRGGRREGGGRRRTSGASAQRYEFCVACVRAWLHDAFKTRPAPLAAQTLSGPPPSSVSGALGGGGEGGGGCASARRSPKKECARIGNRGASAAGAKEATPADVPSTANIGPSAHLTSARANWQSMYVF